MTLQDIFDLLTYGELSQLSIGGIDATDEQGNSDPGIQESDRKQLIQDVQLGLTALYKRFRLKDSEVSVLLANGRKTYVLSPEFSISNVESNELNKYLIDTPEDPFTGSMMKIEEIYAEYQNPDVADQCYSHPVPVNVKKNPYAIKSPSLKLIMVPDDFGFETPPQTLRILYRANHPKLDMATSIAAPFATEIELPEMFTSALLYFVASRVMNPVGMVQEFHSGNSYYAKYESECQRLEFENYDQDHLDEAQHFALNGFC